MSLLRLPVLYALSCDLSSYRTGTVEWYQKFCNIQITSNLRSYTCGFKWFRACLCKTQHATSCNTKAMENVPEQLQQKMFADLIRLLTTLMQSFNSVTENAAIRNDMMLCQGTSNFVAEEHKESFEEFKRMMRSIQQPEHVPEASPRPMNSEEEDPDSSEDLPCPTPPLESPQLGRSRSRSR